MLREDLACQFGDHSRITEALPTLTSKITSLIDYLGQANIALTELVSTLLVQLVTVRDTAVTVQDEYKVLYNTGIAHR